MSNIELIIDYYYYNYGACINDRTLLTTILWQWVVIVRGHFVNIPDFTITFLDKRPFLLMPALSSSTRPRSPSSMRIHPLNPLEMQSFQKDV